jgi:MYXO-CTERM domain-containing protein
MRNTVATVAGLFVVAAMRSAHAFCGFYVSGADAKLTNNATQVVLMRDGTRTVLSMQNGYQGPPQDFAMVVPVPVVLQKENVKTLTRDVFDHVDQLTAPRLVEYWEQDPCPRPVPVLGNRLGGGGVHAAAPPPMSRAAVAPLVKVEAQFTVGEYDIVVLSATDSTALDAWLRQNAYKIPAGAEPYLRPYVEMGMKFFVAKVDVAKVKFERIGNGPEQAVLSPLRFHYDSDSFNLPIRLGLINSGGTQDLVVTILARNQRYEVANYDNVAVPTNVDVSDATRADFGAFYTTLFDETLVKHPRAVVTEYSWQTTSCDPCPTPPLQSAELMTLGADVLPAMAPPAPPGGGAPILGLPVRYGALNDFVITRLHTRYSKDALGDDLFFRAAPPIVGGREFLQNDGKLERGARPDATNNFQARYVIRHPWTGPIACSNPQRGIWGGPPNGAGPAVKPVAKVGFTRRAGAVTLASFVRGPLPPESFLSTGGTTPLLALSNGGPSPDAGSLAAPVPEPDAAATGAPPAATASAPVPTTAPPQGGCAGCTATSGNATGVGAVAAMVALALTRVRRRRSTAARKRG